MDEKNSTDSLHGMTLQAILEDLVGRHGWPWMAEQIPIRCFTHEPTITSSLRFLRKTPWARSQTEALYVKEQRRIKRNVRRKYRATAKRAHDAARAAAPQEPTLPGPMST